MRRRPCCSVPSLGATYRLPGIEPGADAARSGLCDALARGRRNARRRRVADGVVAASLIGADRQFSDAPVAEPRRGGRRSPDQRVRAPLARLGTVGNRTAAGSGHTRRGGRRPAGRRRLRLVARPAGVVPAELAAGDRPVRRAVDPARQARAGDSTGPGRRPGRAAARKCPSAPDPGPPHPGQPHRGGAGVPTICGTDPRRAEPPSVQPHVRADLELPGRACRGRRPGRSRVAAASTMAATVTAAR